MGPTLLRSSEHEAASISFAIWTRFKFQMFSENPNVLRKQNCPEIIKPPRKHQSVYTVQQRPPADGPPARKEAHLLLGDSNMFWGQMGNVVHPESSRSAPGSPTQKTSGFWSDLWVTSVGTCKVVFCALSSCSSLEFSLFKSWQELYNYWLRPFQEDYRTAWTQTWL